MQVNVEPMHYVTRDFEDIFIINFQNQYILIEFLLIVNI